MDAIFLKPVVKFQLDWNRNKKETQPFRDFIYTLYVVAGIIHIK